ncbi:MAG: extracellular matrix regulator RemB [Eubacteriales bacterium]
MFLHLSQACVLDKRDVIGVFDMDTATISPDSRKFLRESERKKRLHSVAKDIPKSFVLTENAVYLASPSPGSIRGHLEE